MNDAFTRELSEETVAADPIDQFARWFRDAGEAGVTQPEGMSLATVDAGGQPSVRVVLLKHFDADGFVFFTNYLSRKGRALAVNPLAALGFWWDPLERQVRIEGDVEQVSPEESDAYYRTRPLGSRIGAWASPQSDVIAGRSVLEEQVRRIEERFAGTEETLPRPEHWGGYRVRPQAIEFWQGRVSRLHDRIRYSRTEPGNWTIERLAP